MSLRLFIQWDTLCLAKAGILTPTDVFYLVRCMTGLHACRRILVPSGGQLIPG